MKKKKITAAELMASLHADPQWVAMMAKKAEEREARAAEHRRVEAPLVDELRAAGIQVKSAWDLVNTSKPYPEALPILLKHLQHPYPPPIREGIARALAVTPAKFGWPVFTRLFREVQEEQTKDGLAVAIAATADDSVFDELAALAHDRNLGSSRQLFLRALGRSKNPQARVILRELASDPDVHIEAESVLRRLEKRKKQPRFRPDENPELRGAEAEKFAAKHLRKLHTSMESWETELEDKETGEKWLMDYPDSPGTMSGSPRLRMLRD